MKDLMLPDYFEFCSPTKIIFGMGVLDELEESLKLFGPRRVLLVTDRILLEAGPVDLVKKGLENSNLSIVCTYSNVPPDSTIQTVEACAQEGLQHQCDLILAVGGGSVMDTAKVTNLLMTQGGSVRDHQGAYLLGNLDVLPMIFVPTTAGTGSEVTKVAVIADTKNQVKLAFTENQFLPKLAILDPRVTVSMPPKLTAMTGMDALTHAIEAYVGKEHGPASDAFALQAIQLIHQNILIACHQPENLQARGAMLVASCMAGMAFSHSMVGMTHGIAHALGGVYHLPHGLANAIVLPEVMEYNLPGLEGRYADIADALGVGFPQLIQESERLFKFCRLPKMAEHLTQFQWVDEWFKKQAAKAGIAKVRELNQQLAYLTRMPLSLRDAGISDNLEQLELVVQTAMEDGAMLYNIREPQADDVRRILKRLYDPGVLPLKVSPDQLIGSDAVSQKQGLTQVFADTEMLYRVLFAFFGKMLENPTILESLNHSKLCVQFVYQNPAGIITLDATSGEAKIIQGSFDGIPMVIFSMNADIAHSFWHGKVNLLSAVTRRQIMAKGNVPQAVKLLPILKPAYDEYPKFLHQQGWDHLILK